MSEHSVDKFTIRGIVYSAISVLGLGYEFFFSHPPRAFLLIMYSLVIGIGLICIFMIKEQEHER